MRNPISDFLASVVSLSLYICVMCNNGLQRFMILKETFYVESRELCMHGLSLPGNCKYQNIWFLVNCTKYIIIATYYAKCMGHMLYMAKETTIDQKTFSVCYDQYRP